MQAICRGRAESAVVVRGVFHATPAFTIAASHQGWQLYEGEHGRSSFDSLSDARDNAKLLAATLFEHHGIPTAVVMDMAGREAVVLARHG